MVKLPGVPVAPHSDVYGFARTLCYALFQTPQPLMRHWRGLPPALAELLESCLEEEPKQRPAGFAEVLQVLDRLAGSPSGAQPAAPAKPAEPGAGGDRRRE